MKIKKWDFILILLWPLIAGLLSYITHTTFFGTIFWFFVAPSIYLSLRAPYQIKKSLLVSLAGTFLGLLFDYSAEVTNTWVFPETIFPFKVLHVTPIEVPIWFFVWVYFVVMFYEYFLETYLHIFFFQLLI